MATTNDEMMKYINPTEIEFHPYLDLAANRKAGELVELFRSANLCVVDALLQRDTDTTTEAIGNEDLIGTAL